MKGRWKRWILAGLAGSAVGCGTTRKQALPSAELPTPGGKPSLLARAFGDKGFVPEAPPAEQPVIQPARKPGEGLKPQTEVEVAHAELEGAFMEGRSTVERDRLLDSARHRYQRALKADPKNKAALVGLARLYALSGDRERSLATFQTALEHHPQDHQLAHRMAAVQIQFEDWKGAAETCRYALSLDPENRTYIKTLGFCQAHLGQFQEAGETLVRVMPESQALYFLGRVLIDTNRVEEGRHWIQTAAAKDPENHAAKEFLAALDSGQLTTQQPIQQAGHAQPAAPER